MANLKEAHTFLNSFLNTDARNFVRTVMTKNYAHAIQVHHPQPKFLNNTLVSSKCHHLVDSTFQRIAQIQSSPEKLFPLFAQLSRKQSEKDAIWFDEFTSAYQAYKHQHKLRSRYEKIRSFLKGSSYCDVGCGGGNFAAFLQRKHPLFKRVAGIDTMDWRTETIKDEIDFQVLDFSQVDTASSISYETMSCFAVLHHVGNTDAAQGVFLRNLYNSLAPGGRLIVLEDVILPKEELANLPYLSEQISHLCSQQAILADFLNLDAHTQRDCIVLIDFLANALAVGVPDMPFPCGFRTLKSWVDFFPRYGFALAKVKIAGFVPTNFNQSSHVYFVLDKL
ncbi:class I SAM-dependent methyltransferase [Porifericola rhodea]|uniref:class I SAM-dependent methyltransferase n=1 Tax=Porifericola rhodea TaxID=930972 RepID=UPI002666BE4C|nr:class I SAM-dependent methyltransferase [Porifericola rhodea]WKN32363.1 class I SAM-dependent methyltransferase [Porifericola rhodea]